MSTARPALVLHRDDPGKDPLIGHIKVTREDWLRLARDTLVSDGVAEVKVLTLAARLEVSRSSFYSYFGSRKALLGALLADWEERNTQSIIAQCARPAGSICEAVSGFFTCFVEAGRFDQGLDFAVREWARRDTSVRHAIDDADAKRLAAVTALFSAHGYADMDADVRARILYFMQLGYHALEVREPMQARADRVEGYLEGFTGKPPLPQTVARFRTWLLELEG